MVAKNKQNAFFEDAYSKKNYQNAIKLLEKFSFDVDKFKDKTVKELPQGARKVLDILIAIIGPLLLVISRQHYTIDICGSGLIYYYIWSKI